MQHTKQRPLPEIADATGLEGKYVLVRASLNVPIKDGVVQNMFRLKRTLATVQFLSARGARVIMAGHIGREPNETLRPVAEACAPLVSLAFCDDVVGPRAMRERNALRDGDVMMLENLRSHEGEIANDPGFARELAALADIYVNDSFDASHRAHASMVGVPQHVPSYFGINFVREYEALSEARAPSAPALFMLGGAKFETKLPLVEKYLASYDHVFVGGALAHDIWKAKGYALGKSLVSDIELKGNPIVDAPNLLLPVDVTVKTDAYTRVTTVEDVKPEETIVDAGPETVTLLESYIAAARTILWNGPFGNYEAGFATTTERIAERVASSHARSIVGGGDTVASIESLCLEDRFGFLSTAGGAMLEFLEKGTLPAIDAILERA